MARLTITRLTPEQYLVIDEAAEQRSEYHDGEMFPIEAATPNHGLLTFNSVGILHVQLNGKRCIGFGNSLRIQVSATGLYTYPDVVIVCGSPQVEKNTLLNPTLIVEVLSPTTEGYDRGKKFDSYRTIESFVQYVLVAQDRVQVLVHTRTHENDWLMKEFTRLEDTVELTSIGCKIPVGKLYENVDFSAPDAPTTA